VSNPPPGTPTAFVLQRDNVQEAFNANQNISYFVGFDADETLPQSLLSGDRNITNSDRAQIDDGVVFQFRMRARRNDPLVHCQRQLLVMTKTSMILPVTF
jgi:hypothetical protein